MKIKTSHRRIIFLSIILFYLILPTAAMANSAPIIQPGINGAIIPIHDIPIVVKEEKLQFVLHEAYKPADVVVQYTFLNPTDKPIDAYLAFPYTPDVPDSVPRVFINGVELPKSSIEINKEDRELDRFLEAFNSAAVVHVDPVTGKHLDDWKGYDTIDDSDIATFKVPFPASQETSLRIQYQQDFGTDKKDYIQPIRIYQYLLQPASAWKEFHHLQISIAVPKNHYFASNLSIKQVNGDSIVWLSLPEDVKGNEEKWDYFHGEFEALPKGNLAFSTMNKQDLLFGLVKKDDYDLLGFIFLGVVATAANIGMALLISRIKKWWMHWLLGPVLSFIVTNTITFLTYALFINLVTLAINGELLGGYGFIITFLLFIFYNAVIYFPTLGIILLIKKWRNRRKKSLDVTT